MKRLNGFTDYVETVLSKVRFTEAHSEIRIELLGHLEEAREHAFGGGLSEHEIEALIVRQMGDAHKLGLQLNQVHQPRVNGFVLACLGLLLVIGSIALFHSGHLGAHLLWLGIGMFPLFVLSWLKPASIRARSLAIYGVGVLLGCLGAVIGEWHGGQPYLSFGPIHVKVVELSLVLFVLALAGLMTDATKGNRVRKAIVFAGALLPAAAYGVIGSFYPAFLLTTACLSMLVVSKQSKLMILSYLSLGGGLVAASLGSAVFNSRADSLRGVARASHTDFVFHYLLNDFPALAFIAGVIVLGMAPYLISIIRPLKNIYGKTVSTGAVTLMMTEMVWGLLSNLGFVPMPATGVYFPFLSYSGSLMIAHIALIGMILGVQRRRNLHFC